MANAEFLLTLFRLLDECDLHGSLYWQAWKADRLEDVVWLINCNDQFWWGTADLEPITPENVHLLREAMDELRAVGGNLYRAGELFCAKARKMRPQGAAYPKGLPGDEQVWRLLDACGPERELDYLNPKPAPAAGGHDGNDRRS